MSIDYSFLGVEDLKGDKRVTISNYGRSYVSYSVTLSNGTPVSRTFNPMVSGRPAHSIAITFDELYQLSQAPGGLQLIFDNLYTSDMEVRKAIGLPYDVEEVPEIEYDRATVAKIVKEGTDDELKDLVEFGVGAGLHYLAEWMKEELVTLDSQSRRELIGEMLNVNPETLVTVTKWMAEDEQAGALGFDSIKGLSVSGKVASEKGGRRATGKKAGTEGSTTGKRRAAAKK